MSKQIEKNDTEENHIIQEAAEYKVYKEKPYLNSDKDPLGLTINGKSKEYVLSQQILKDLMKKGKIYNLKRYNMKILDVTKNKAMLNAIIERTLQKVLEKEMLS